MKTRAQISFLLWIVLMFVIPALGQDLSIYPNLLGQGLFDVNTPVWSKEAKDFVIKGRTADRTSKYEDAVIYYEKALARYESDGKTPKNAPEILRLHSRIAVLLLRHLRETTKAEDHFKKIVDLACTDRKGTLQRIDALYNLADCALKRGRLRMHAWRDWQEAYRKAAMAVAVLRLTKTRAKKERAPQRVMDEINAKMRAAERDLAHQKARKAVFWNEAFDQWQSAVKYCDEIVDVAEKAAQTVLSDAEKKDWIGKALIMAAHALWFSDRLYEAEEYCRRIGATVSRSTSDAEPKDTDGKPGLEKPKEDPKRDEERAKKYTAAMLARFVENLLTPDELLARIRKERFSGASASDVFVEAWFEGRIDVEWYFVALDELKRTLGWISLDQRCRIDPKPECARVLGAAPKRAMDHYKRACEAAKFYKQQPKVAENEALTKVIDEKLSFVALEVAEYLLQERRLKDVGRYCRKARDYAAPHKLVWFQQRAEICLAELARALGRYEKALEHIKLAAACNPKGHSVEDPRLSLVRARTLRDMGDVEGAMTEYGSAEARLTGALKDAAAMELGMMTRENMGAYRSELFDQEDDLLLHGRAGRWFEQALRFFMGRPALILQYCSVDASDLLRGLRDVPVLHKRLTEIFLASDRPDWKAPALLAKNDHKAALDQYIAMERNIKETGDFSRLPACYTGQGLCCERAGRFNDAAMLYQKAIDLIEDTRASLSRNERSKFLSAASAGGPRTAPYEGLARVLLKAGRFADAVVICEKIRDRAFADKMLSESDELPPAIPEDVRAVDRKLKTNLAQVRTAMMDDVMRYEGAGLRKHEADWEKARAELRSHIWALHEKYPREAAAVYPEDVHLEKSSLLNDERVIYYEVTDEALLVFVLKGRKVVKVMTKDVTRADLDKLIGEMRSGIKKHPHAKAWDLYVSSSKKLYELLLKDVLAEIPEGAAVIIMPDETLAKIPFGALIIDGTPTIVMRDKAGNVIAEDDFKKKSAKIKAEDIRYSCSGGKFFEDRNTLSYYQSIRTLHMMRERDEKTRPQNNGELLVFADPLFEKGDPRLMRLLNGAWTVDCGGQDEGLNRRAAYATVLTRSLSETFGPKTAIYMGADASKANLKASCEAKGRFGALLFLTHGLYAGAFQDPFLSLANIPVTDPAGGHLSASEVVRKLDFKVDLVALSACQTGRGRIVSGEGMDGLARAFQMSGARTVIVTLWSVTARATVDLMGRFFKHYHSGKEKGEALQLAIREIRQNGWDHPNFWSPMIAYGEAN
jgi:CHAT domain-containing protein